MQIKMQKKESKMQIKMQINWHYLDQTPYNFSFYGIFIIKYFFFENLRTNFLSQKYFCAVMMRYFSSKLSQNNVKKLS